MRLNQRVRRRGLLWLVLALPLALALGAVGGKIGRQWRDREPLGATAVGPKPGDRLRGRPRVTWRLRRRALLWLGLALPLALALGAVSASAASDDNAGGHSEHAATQAEHKDNARDDTPRAGLNKSNNGERDHGGKSSGGKGTKSDRDRVNPVTSTPAPGSKAASPTPPPSPPAAPPVFTPAPTLAPSAVVVVKPAPAAAVIVRPSPPPPSGFVPAPTPAPSAPARPAPAPPSPTATPPVVYLPGNITSPQPTLLLTGFLNWVPYEVILAAFLLLLVSLVVTTRRRRRNGDRNS